VSPEHEQPPRPLAPAEAEPAAVVVARSFAWHEPWGAWALPDESSREDRLREIVEADIRERFLPLGRASTIGCLCVTLWIPPPSHPDAGAFGSRRDDAAYERFGDRAEALRASDELLASLRPAGDHWYLDTIATDPAWMRKGLGGRLLDHDLTELDGIGASAALDTHGSDNVAFYERRGFRVVASDRVPHDGPPLYVMVREPTRSE
jgi:GNAT superfamily N-acetyltransferase